MHPASQVGVTAAPCRHPSASVSPREPPAQKRKARLTQIGNLCLCCRNDTQPWMSWRQSRHVPCVGNADWGQPQLRRRAVRNRPQFADSFKGCDSIPLSGSQTEKPFHLLLSQGLYHCTGRKFVLPAREHGIRTHRVGLLRAVYARPSEPPKGHGQRELVAALAGCRGEGGF